MRWLEESQSRDFDLAEDLIVITAQTGDEYPDTGHLISQHPLPRMRARKVRYVQVARAGHLEADGIVVMSDTRSPDRIHLEGAYKLSDELRAAGTVPQYAGEHRCSLKFKAWVIEAWLAQEMTDQSYCHAFGFSAEEQKRIDKSERAFAHRESVRVVFGFNVDEERRIIKAQKYDTPQRLGWYPLAHDWRWTRSECERYLKEVTGEDWFKSACVYCPFNKLTGAGIARLRRFPSQVAESLMLEHQSLCFNPRGTLYRNRTLRSIMIDDGNQVALAEFEQALKTCQYALYRVRRIYKAPGHADRAVEKLVTGPRQEIASHFAEIASGLPVKAEHSILYGYVRERELERYPTVEEFFVVAPATVASKTRHGFAWFEERWAEALGSTAQIGLFEDSSHLAVRLEMR
ncbi:MAG: hypothetical protein AB7U82_25865 [Blastocatellales bacterium]